MNMGYIKYVGILWRLRKSFSIFILIIKMWFKINVLFLINMRYLNNNSEDFVFGKMEKYFFMFFC